MHWLIDGHNLIGQMPTMRLDDANDEAKLLEYLSRYRARTGHAITVFFDSGQVYRPASKRKHGGVTVRFAPHGKTADHLIMRRLRKVKNPQAIGVVTSDRAVQQAARFAQVRVVSSQEFAQELLNLATQVAEENRAEIELSADEVEAWLEIFNNEQSKKD